MCPVLSWWPIMRQRGYFLSISPCSPCVHVIRCALGHPDIISISSPCILSQFEFSLEFSGLDPVKTEESVAHIAGAVLRTGEAFWHRGLLFCGLLVQQHCGLCIPSLQSQRHHRGFSSCSCFWILSWHGLCCQGGHGSPGSCVVSGPL